MNPDQKLALLTQAIKDAGMKALVMGGHAVRYYGIDRNTSDFDMVVGTSSPTELREKLAEIPMLASAKEIPVWRTNDFARFEIGTLPDGRQELLEFWLQNHLLSDFATLNSRAEVGNYGGSLVAFLSLDDLIRSKETERESDWQDISLLEEIRDARLLAKAVDDDGVVRALANVRSRRGLERLDTSGLLADSNLIEQAIHQCTHPVTFAILSPLAPVSEAKQLVAPIEPTALVALRRAPFRSSLHLGLVEVVRRGYKRQAMEEDRLDKEGKVRDLKGN